MHIENKIYKISGVFKFIKQWTKSCTPYGPTQSLSHYSDDIEITNPPFKLATTEDRGMLKGNNKVSEYWCTTLKNLNELHFGLIVISIGVNLVLRYKSLLDQKAV